MPSFKREVSKTSSAHCGAISRARQRSQIIREPISTTLSQPAMTHPENATATKLPPRPCYRKSTRRVALDVGIHRGRPRYGYPVGGQGGLATCRSGLSHQGSLPARQNRGSSVGPYSSGRDHGFLNCIAASHSSQHEQCPRNISRLGTDSCPGAGLALHQPRPHLTSHPLGGLAHNVSA